MLWINVKVNLSLPIHAIKAFGERGGGGISKLIQICNTLKTKINLHYVCLLKLVPHRDQIVHPLERTAGERCLWKYWLFIVRIIRNTQIHCVDRTTRL